MKYIGIDPGRNGAIAIIYNNGDDMLQTMNIFDIPLTSDKKKVDVNKLFHFLYSISDGKQVKCVLEKAQTMPGQGGVSNFSYGMTYGKTLSVLEILNIPFTEVHPMTWKKEFGILKSSKGMMKKDKKLLALKKANELFPSMKKCFYTERGKLLDGRVEALLLAEFCKNFKTKRTKRGKK